MNPNDDDVAAIAAATQTYLDGLYEGDADKLGSVFLPTSALTQSLNGEVVITPRDAWLAAVRQRPAPKASGLGRHDQILTIDRISANLAHVKLNCAIPPRFFTDILSFVKTKDGWKIAQKVFTTDVRG
ncbi:MAG: nuclear transport factor 2 family protein [Beijerinckiaceae bacterium]|nr:nuclear transport factor 2 family protein [Beijerinckiaceae bacterium]